MKKVREFLNKINIRGGVWEHESMALHTSFQVGGPADLYVEPLAVEECIEAIRLAQACSLPWIVLGAGSNVLVADAGIEGVVISTIKMCKLRLEELSLTAEAGAMVDTVVEESCRAGLAGIEFLAGMPGSIGGAVWMNARCYGSEVSEVLSQVTYLDANLELQTLHLVPGTGEDEKGFGYKKSPFQGKSWTILNATFQLTSKDPMELDEKVQQFRKDREKKGHYLAPSAGSVFKNDRAFGAPAGVILDRLGFKGFRIGDAEVSPLHANIILNRGTARARDIRTLIEHMQKAVQKVYGRTLEPEILFLGRWDS